MSHIQYKYQTRHDFKLLYSNIKHIWKCSNIMENENKTYIFLLILFPPFWVVAINDKLSFSSNTTNDRHQKEARLWLHIVCARHEIIIKFLLVPTTSSHLWIKTIMIWSELIKLHTFKYTNKIWNTKKRKVLALSFLQRICKALHTVSLSASDASAVLILLQFSLQTAVCCAWVCVSMCVSRGARCRDHSERVGGGGPRIFIRPRTRRSSAWCCPAWSVAGSCICLGRPGRSRCGGGRSGCSWIHRGPEPALRSGPEGREGGTWDTVLA